MTLMVSDTALAAAADLFTTVREYQDETERDSRIPPPLVQRLREAGLYCMLLPHRLGGLELDLPTCFRIVELLAEADASVGWNLMNNAVIQVASLAFDDAGIDEIYASGRDQIIAGTLVPGGGQGTRLEGGFAVTGRWRFGSGCREARWMIGNFDVEGDTEGVYRFAVPVDACTIVDSWDVTGMRGTGSHDWSVADVFVPERRVVYVPGRLVFNQWRSRWPGTLYDLPVASIIGPHHSMIATGIARAGIDALAELAGSKTPRGRVGLLRERPQVQEWIARAEAHLGGGRTYRDGIVREMWATVAAGEEPGVDQCARCRLAGSFAADSARAAMDLVYRAAGTTATQRTDRLAHCWRDLHVVAQAAAVSPDWYPIAGRVLLGLDPGVRFV